MPYEVRCGERVFQVEFRQRGGALEAVVDGEVLQVDAHRPRGDSWSLILGGSSFDLSLWESSGIYAVHIEGRELSVEVRDPRRLRRRPGISRLEGYDPPGEQTIRATMPGRVVTVLAPEGEEVSAGQGVIVIEAMKMENELRAPKGGVVKEVLVSPGQAVESGQSLLVIA